MTRKREVFISVDIETSGPIPGEFAMLSIGACLVDDPAQTFSCLLRPTTRKADPQALEVSGLDLDVLYAEGLAPEVAMERLESWVADVSGEDASPVFVGFNAPFDWSFVNYYFHRFLGRNPFGFTALDVKAMYLGATGCAWQETRSSAMSAALHPKLEGDHDALHDALYQAELFRLVRAKSMARQA